MEGIGPSVWTLRYYTHLCFQCCHLLLQIWKQFTIIFCFFSLSLTIFVVQFMLLVTFSFNLNAYQVLKICYLINFIFKCIVAFDLFSYAFPLLSKCFNFVCIYYVWWTLILLLLLFCLMDFNLATFNIATLCFPLHAVISFVLYCYLLSMYICSCRS